MPARRRPTSLAGRLLVPLLAVVGGVMAAFAVWALVQRERTQVAEARRETQAYATALGLALEAAFREPERTSVSAIVERITREPTIYAVVVYDEQGEPIVDTSPATDSRGSTPQEVSRVLDTGRPAELERVQGETDVYSVVRAVLDDEARVVGAFEVLQPLSFVEQEKTRTRIRFALNTVVLLGAVTAVILWLVRRLISDPLSGFTDDVRALGRGELDHRVDPSLAVGELAIVAAELNQMAAGLEGARAELVRSTEERVALERHVRESERMALVGRLAAGLAHEIGAPLHVIRGRADLLLKRGALTESEARNLRIIAEQIDRITRIVRNLLDFSRASEPRLAPVDLVAIVDGALELLSTELEPAGIAARRTGVPSVVVTGDRDQLQQVVLNLLLNARQALAEAVGARRIEVDVTAGGAAGGVGHACVRVTDNGPGIAPEHRDRVFDPFFTTKAEGSGTGLGLAVARRIVEDHGGRIELAAGAPGSTTFSVTLPRSEGGPA